MEPSKELDTIMEKIILNSPRNVPEKIETGIRRLLLESPVQYCRKLVGAIESRENIPPNYYGFIDGILRGYKRDDDKRRESSEKFSVSDSGCSGAQEYRLHMQILQEIQLWHKIGLSEIDHDSITMDIDRYVPQSIDEFALNPVKTWSPILDHFLSELQLAKEGPYEARESFLEKYLSMLQSERVKRFREPLRAIGSDFELKSQKYRDEWNKIHPETVEEPQLI